MRQRGLREQCPRVRGQSGRTTLERPGRADEAPPAKALGVRPLGTRCKEKREFLGERLAGLLGVSPAAPLSPRL